MHKILKGTEPEHFQKWKREFLKDNGRNALYSDLIGTPEYGRLKQSLLDEQGYVCCYCEKAIGRFTKSDCDIEHFMPRNPDDKILSLEECEQCRNAQLDYRNLMVSCMGEEVYSLNHCNHRKDNWFDFSLCVSPIEDEIETLFGFRIDGKIYAIGSNVKGEALKKHLNLDTYVLREQRKAAYDAVIELEFESDELFNDTNYIMDTIECYRQKNEFGYFAPFCSMITYCLEHEFLA